MDGPIEYDILSKHLIYEDLTAIQNFVREHGTEVLELRDVDSNANLLEEAVFLNRAEIFDYLINYLPPIATHNNGLPLLVLACTFSGKYVVEKLLELGLDPNLPGPDECYPLTVCDIFQKKDIEILLIRYGAYRR